MLATKGFARQRVTIELKANGLPALSNASLAMGGRLDGAPLSLRAAVTGEKARRATLTARWRSLDAKADLSMAASGALEGVAKLGLQRLADIAPFTGIGLAGAADASITFHTRRGKTKAGVDARFSGLGVDATTAQTMSVSGSVSDVTGKPHFDLDMAGSRIAVVGWNGDAR